MSTELGPFPISPDTQALAFLAPSCGKAKLGLWFEGLPASVNETNVVFPGEGIATPLPAPALPSVYWLAGTAQADLVPGAVDVTFQSRLLGNIIVSLEAPGALPTDACDLSIVPDSPQNQIMIDKSVSFPKGEVGFNPPVVNSHVVNTTVHYPVPPGAYTVTCAPPVNASNAAVAHVAVDTGEAQVVHIMLPPPDNKVDLAGSHLVAVGPQTLMVNQQADFDVVLVDGSGQPVSGATATISATHSAQGQVVITQPGPTDAQGTGRAHVITQTPGEVVVSAQVNGRALASTLSFTFTPDTTFFADPARTEVVIKRGEALNDGNDQASFSVVVRNSIGIALPGSRVELTVSCAPTADPCPGTLSPGTFVTDGQSPDALDGMVTFSMTSAAVTRTNFAIKVQGPEGSPVPITNPVTLRFIAPGTFSLEQSTFSINPSGSASPALADGYYGYELMFEARDITGSIMSFPSIEVWLQNPNGALALEGPGGPICVNAGCATNGVCAPASMAEPMFFTVNTTTPGAYPLEISVCDNGERRPLPRRLAASFEPAVQKQFSNNSGDQPDLAVSPDGRYWVFSSSDMLLPTAPPGWLSFTPQIYRYDAMTDQLDIVTCNNGTCGDFPSRHPSVSADGSWVAFESGATPASLGVTGATGVTGPAPLIYARDMTSGTIYLVSKNTANAWPNGSSTSPSVAVVNGETRVAFLSSASDLDSVEVTDSDNDVFLWRRSGAAANQGTLWRVHPDSSAIPATSAVLSADGLKIAFAHSASAAALNASLTESNGKGDVFLSDVPATEGAFSAPSLVSHATGAPNQTSNGMSRAPAFSRDNKSVLFESFASNLVATTGPSGVVIYRSESNTVTRTALSSSITAYCTDGNEPNTNNPSQTCLVPTHDSSARFFSFQTADSLAGDIPSIYGGGLVDTNSEADAYLYDDKLHTTHWLSRHPEATSSGCGTAQICNPSMTADGREAYFTSARNLLPTASGVSLHRRANPFLEVAPSSVTSAPSGIVESAGFDVTANGREVIFVSSSPDSVMVLDRWSGFTDIVSISFDTGMPLPGPYMQPRISPTGRFVSFVAGSQVYAVDRFQHVQSMASMSNDGNPSVMPCHSPALIDDLGSSSAFWVAFVCETAANANMPSAPSGITSGFRQAFVRMLPKNEMVPPVTAIASTDGVSVANAHVTSIAGAPYGAAPMVAFTYGSELVVTRFDSGLSGVNESASHAMNDLGSPVAGATFSNLQISADGQFLVFASSADLVTTAPRAGVDVFVRKIEPFGPLATDILVVSRRYDGSAPTADIDFRPAGVSADGRFIGLIGRSQAMVPAHSMLPLRDHTYVRDMFGPSANGIRGAVYWADVGPGFVEGPVSPSNGAVAPNGRGIFYSAGGQIYFTPSPWGGELGTTAGGFAAQ